MKLLKILLGIFVAIIAVLALVVFLGLQNINEIIKVAVETTGPKVTGTEVTLNSVEISLTEGRGELYGLQIDNPQGYSSDYAFSMGEVALQVDPGSLTGGVIVIKEVLIDGAKLIAEQKDLSRINIQDILDNVKKLSAGKGAGKTPDKGVEKPAASSETAAKDETRLMIEKFSFINSDVTLLTEKWGEHQLSMADINLTNIGDRNTGLSPEQLTQAILDPILAQAKSSVSKNLEKLARDEAASAVEKKLDEKLNDTQKEQLKDLKGLFE